METTITFQPGKRTFPDDHCFASNQRSNVLPELDFVNEPKKPRLSGYVVTAHVRHLHPVGRHSFSGIPDRLRKNPDVNEPTSAPILRFLSPGAIARDEANHLVVQENDIIKRRYQVLKRLGRGTFGRVHTVKDLTQNTSELLALKICASTDDAQRDSEFEIKVLNALLKLDPHATNRFVKMHTSFVYHGHPCILFERLGDSLHKFLVLNEFRPYNMDQIRHIAYQLCSTVGFLHRNKLTHTDLKTENVVFACCSRMVPRADDPKQKMRTIVDRTDIRVIDFGSAVFDHENKGEAVTTRQYRAPEVTLRLKWSHPCDVWSIGCILFELYSGNTLFQSPSSLDQLAVMERILGPIPPHMITERANKYYRNGKLIYDRRLKVWRDLRAGCKPLQESMRDSSTDTRQLFDLISRMFEYDPKTRLQLHSGVALEHPFFKGHQFT